MKNGITLVIRVSQPPRSISDKIHSVGKFETYGNPSPDKLWRMYHILFSPLLPSYSPPCKKPLGLMVSWTFRWTLLSGERSLDISHSPKCT